jgi:hypothetical protein
LLSAAIMFVLPATIAVADISAFILFIVFIISVIILIIQIVKLFRRGLGGYLAWN